jgi:3',5'-cyclic AMP phosphodiesterase CpdA
MNATVPITHLRLSLIFLWISLISLASCLALPSAYAASANLVWKPYLQQVTDTSVIIIWVTQTGANSLVRYSTDTSYSSSASGSSRSTAFGTQLHRVELSGLQPNTSYNYKLYTESEDLLPGELLSFQMAPLTGSQMPFTFIVFGDYGRNSDSQRLLRDQMLLDSFRFILTTGDNAYNDGTYAQFDSRVFQIYQDIFSKVGLFPTLGNHDDNTNNGAPYLDIFDLPSNAWRAGDKERYYAFDYGNVHFVALDSNAPLDADDNASSDDMFDWLRQDLSQTSQPWKIVALHHPAYSTGPHGSDSRVQAKLVPIFEAYGVDIVFSGHDHIYQRSQPLRGGQGATVGQGGIVYIVSGAGSAASYGCNNAFWTVISYCSQSYGLYARVVVNGNSLTVEAIDDTGAIRDDYAISQVNMPVEAATIGGASTGLVQTANTVTAAVSPITATLPITYVWQATGQAPVMKVGGLANSVTFTWNETGVQTVSVTATSTAGGLVNATHIISIVPVSDRIYLPLTVKN